MQGLACLPLPLRWQSSLPSWPTAIEGLWTPPAHSKGSGSTGGSKTAFLQQGPTHAVAALNAESWTVVRQAALASLAVTGPTWLRLQEPSSGLLATPLPSSLRTSCGMLGQSGSVESLGLSTERDVHDVCRDVQELFWSMGQGRAAQAGFEQTDREESKVG